VRDLPAPGVRQCPAASPTIATAIRSTTRWPPLPRRSRLYKLDADKLEWKFLYQDETVLDTSNIETKMVYVTSRDGAKVPMFVSTKEGVKLDGSNPTVIYGYGGQHRHQGRLSRRVCHPGKPWCGGSAAGFARW
jgi:prolyl oligopeptidase